ncbi:MAG TPA: hypothetical protein VFS23_23000, partial [Vicinamibacterales bacterium]|nr:hypothetical protein [Vicinamibacterales bacterium]
LTHLPCDMNIAPPECVMTIVAKTQPWWCRGLVCAAIAVSSGQGAFEARQPATPPATAVQVRVKTIINFTVPLVGQQVRVVDGVVSRVASPRLVILSGTGLHAPLSLDSVAVIVETGTAMISTGEQVMVTGVVHGFVAQQEDVGRPLIGTLTMAEREALRKRPLLVASSSMSFVRR